MYVPRILGVIAALMLARPLAAQCPDGTPPPCGRPVAAPAARVVVDENLIAIFPFRITGTSSDAIALREGAMDLLGLALDEQANLRVVPSRTLLARARSFTDASPVSDAAALARGLGAGVMILGNAVVVGGQVRARAELHDAIRNRSLASVEARGAASDPGPVIDSLAAGLARVRLVGGGGRRSIAEFGSNSPQALRAYLAGERLGRQGRWQAAADSLELALRLDSTFGLAYYRLVVTSSFGAVTSRDRRELVLLGMRYLDRIPPRQQELLRLQLTYMDGVATRAIAQADALAARFPDDAEFAYEQGEAHFHFGLALGEPPSLALAAYERAIRLDSSFIDPYNHAAELHVMRGDSAVALALAQRGLEVAPTSDVHLAVSFAVRAITRGETPAHHVAAYERVKPGAAPPLARIPLEIARMLDGQPGRAVRLGLPYLDVLSAGRPLSPRGVSLATLGRFRAASAEYDMALRLSPANVIQAANAVYLAMLSGEGLAERVAALRRAIPPGETAHPAWALAGWAAAMLGDSAAATGAVAGLSETPLLPGWPAAMQRAVGGRLALARGDTAAALDRLARAYGVRPLSQTQSYEVSPFIALELARLERAKGQLAAADSRLSAATFANGQVPLRALMEELRAQIAEARGDNQAAVRSYSRFIDLWKDADPELQPRVAAAREALRRLEGGR